MTVAPETLVAERVAPACDLAIARFRLHARRRTEWLRRLWMAEGEPGDRAALAHAEIETILADRDSPEAEAAWFAAQPWADEWTAAARRAAEGLADPTSRIARLQQVFGLSIEEIDLVEGTMAVALDPALARLCAYLQDQSGRPYLTDDLAARIYLHGRSGRLSSESAIHRWEFVVSRDAGVGEPRALACDPQVRDWIAERDSLHEALVGIARLHPPRAPFASWPIAETADAVRRRLSVEPATSTRLIVVGPIGSGRRTFAAAVCERLRLPLLTIDADPIDDASWRRVFMIAQRHGFLERTALAWVGESAARRAWPQTVSSFPVQCVISETMTETGAPAGFVDHVVRLDGPNAVERHRLWLEHVPSAREWPEEEVRSLAERYRAHVSDIVAAGRADSTSASEAGQRVREVTRSRLGQLAQLMPCPFAWDDLVVPQPLRDQLEDFAFEARHRAAFWEQREPQRLFPQGQGLLALASGPPGVGKSMSAQILAAALGYDLYRVNLAAVISKWVGESSQNFERILTRAAGMHAMILFDECDAILSKRTAEVRDAQDKFANTDSAHLLQAIEAFPGIALLATNQKGSIDPAFIRRLRYVFEFTNPEAAERLEIWRRVVGGLCGAERLAALDSGLTILADAVAATGAQIKYASLGAVFGAQRDGVAVALRHLVRGLERELAKEGRALGTRERARVLQHGE